MRMTDNNPEQMCTLEHDQWKPDRPDILRATGAGVVGTGLVSRVSGFGIVEQTGEKWPQFMTTHATNRMLQQQCFSPVSTTRHGSKNSRKWLLRHRRTSMKASMRVKKIPKR
jgi:hypothetical protein